MSSFLHAPRISTTESGFLSRFVVRFLSRPGCHLCDDARPGVIFEVDRAGGVVEEVDVDTDDLLVRDYGVRIPIVLGDDDAVLAEGLIDQKELRKALRHLMH